jgi:hypothetical protein
VAWGLDRASTVVVRTLGGTFFWAGHEPSNAAGYGRTISRWPPSPEATRTIDDDFAAASAAAAGEDAARDAHALARERWLSAKNPSRLGLEPVHSCSILVPGDNETYIEFEDLDREGDLCGAYRREGSPSSFGSVADVIAAVAERDGHDPWVLAVAAAVVRDRTLPAPSRRGILEVRAVEGELFHASPAINRESIRHHGLDWRRMGAAPGIAGSTDPEAPGIFLCEDRREVDFFLRMARSPTNVWAVRCEGSFVENGPSGWLILPEPVPPDGVVLIDADIPAHRPRSTAPDG